MTERAKITEPQRRELLYAANNHFGLTYHATTINGLGAAAKRRMMDRLCIMGLFTKYVHGGYEITAAGRAALSLGEGVGAKESQRD
jgi:hypothetical protein